MADPSKERIAAALALAEAVHVTTAGGHLWPARVMATEILSAARAFAETAPKLRTRAEVDAEIGSVARELHADTLCSGPHARALEDRLSKLCREETAPQCDECGLVQGTPEAKGVVMTFQSQGNQKWYCTRGGCAYEPNRVTDHDADTRGLQDPEPCGCEEAEALKRELHELKFRQATIHGIASQDRPVTGVELGRIAKLSLP